VEYQQIAAGWFVSCPEYGCPFSFGGGCWGKGCGADELVFVFGTLLGPEATGPGVVRGL
jgi:hypothetical protein